MESIRCKIGIHDWNGCTCRRCGKQRDEAHNWYGCKCATCGKTRNEFHCFNNPCVCAKCGIVKHSYEIMEQKDTIPDCVYSAGEPCTGPDHCKKYPGSGKCENFPGEGTRWEFLKCCLCGAEAERTFKIGEEVPYYAKHKYE